MDCMICDKHKSSEAPVFSSETFRVYHFPVLNGELAINGHLLIEPRRHITSPLELSDLEAAEMGVVLRNTMRVQMSHLGAEHVYIFRINDKVPHFHIHAVPRYPGTPKEWYGHKITEYPEMPKIGLKEVELLSAEIKSQWK